MKLLARLDTVAFGVFKLFTFCEGVAHSWYKMTPINQFSMAAIFKPCFKCCFKSAVNAGKEVVRDEAIQIKRTVKSKEFRKGVREDLETLVSELPIPTEMKDSRRHRAWSPDLRITAVDLAHGARVKAINVGGNDVKRIREIS